MKNYTKFVFLITICIGYSLTECASREGASGKKTSDWSQQSFEQKMIGSNPNIIIGNQFGVKGISYQPDTDIIVTQVKVAPQEDGIPLTDEGGRTILRGGGSCAMHAINNASEIIKDILFQGSDSSLALGLHSRKTRGQLIGTYDANSGALREQACKVTHNQLERRGEWLDEEELSRLMESSIKPSQKVWQNIPYAIYNYQVHAMRTEGIKSIGVPEIDTAIQTIEEVRNQIKSHDPFVASFFINTVQEGATSGHWIAITAHRIEPKNSVQFTIADSHNQILIYDQVINNLITDLTDFTSFTVMPEHKEKLISYFDDTVKQFTNIIAESGPSSEALSPVEEAYKLMQRILKDEIPIAVAETYTQIIELMYPE